MSTEKRLVLFIVLSMTCMLGMQALMVRFGWIKSAPPAAAPANPVAAKGAPPAVAAKKGDAAGKPAIAAAKPEKEADKAKPKAEPEAKPKAPQVEIVKADQLVLGRLGKDSPYNLQVRIDQFGGGIASIDSSRFEAEFVDGKPVNRPLQLIQPDPAVPPSFGMNLVLLSAGKGAGPLDPNGNGLGELRLDLKPWEVVRDEKGRVVRDIEGGQEIVLRAKAGNPPVVITRTYRLRKGLDQVELELTFEGPSESRRLQYELAGPHGIPIEGEWYTGTFRDVFVAGHTGGGLQIDTQTAYDIVKAQANPERYQKLPLAFAGVENQYFAILFGPAAPPISPEKRWDEETVPEVVHENAQEKQKSDVSVVVTSREFEVGPNVGAKHTYTIFAGPKTAVALAPVGAGELASYRKGWQIPILGSLGAGVARHIIAPLLTRIYDGTRWVAGLFGGTRGNWGVAIILLVITVRLAMFPLSRKQAIMAKKMQDIQPLLAELKEKHKDDKEKYTLEMFALQRKHGVNMFGGCLPALIQIPIFIGLWQALNNSVALRHAPFILWMRDLSAPDMLFKFPFEIPFIGHWLGPYFNVLPLIVVSLMLVQTRLFQPPALTEEAKMQQSMMKYMMIFMAFMFYKVPSGLGIYFITSSTWSICERLLLPKTLGKKSTVAADSGDDFGDGPDGGKGRPGSGGGGGGGRGGPNGLGGGGGWLDKLQAKMEKLMEEASKDATIRNDDRDRTRDQNPAKPRPKTPPGRRR
jgi:YidC/Oxa1 family membrane protein insertase